MSGNQMAMWFHNTAMHRAYRRFQERAVQLEAPGIPDPINRNFVNLKGFEVIRFIRRMVGDAQTVLVVGDAFRREYCSLRALGKQVIVLDIAMQSGMENFVLGDVSQPLPFEDETFDAIVISEVLEHLVNDHAALSFLRRVLKHDGRFVVSVPFVHDESETHLRVHTPKTIVRLLRAAGFDTKVLVQRGALIVFDNALFKALLHLFNWFAFMVLGRVFYRPILSALSDVDWWLGSRGYLLSRSVSVWGGYIMAVKGEKRDVLTLNAQEYAFAGKYKTSRTSLGSPALSDRHEATPLTESDPPMDGPDARLNGGKKWQRQIC